MVTFFEIVFLVLVYLAIATVTCVKVVIPAIRKADCDRHPSLSDDWDSHQDIGDYAYFLLISMTWPVVLPLGLLAAIVRDSERNRRIRQTPVRVPLYNAETLARMENERREAEQRKYIKSIEVLREAGVNVDYLASDKDPACVTLPDGRRVTPKESARIIEKRVHGQWEDDNV